MRVEVIEFHPDPDYDFQLIPGEKYDVSWEPRYPFRPHIIWLPGRSSLELIPEIGWAKFRTAGSSHSFEAFVLVDKP